MLLPHTPPFRKHRRPARARQTPAPAPPPPATVTILSVTATGGNMIVVAFSAPVTVDEFVGPDGAFTVGEGNAPPSTAQLDATRATVEMTAGVSDGQAWQLSAQPNWLVTAVSVP